MYFGVIVTLLNVVYGIFYMPETLSKESRLEKISFVRLNPFTQFVSIFSVKNLNWIFLVIFLIGVPSGSLQTFFSQFAKDTFHWSPAMIGLSFSLLGAVDILTQSLIMPGLLRKLKVSQIAVIGMVSEMIAYGFIAISGILPCFPFFIAGTFVFGFGDAVFGPAVNGLASGAVSSEEQGRIQGGSQSLQALTRILGPILGGTLYISLGPFAPAVMGMLLAGAAIVAMKGNRS